MDLLLPSSALCRRQTPLTAMVLPIGIEVKNESSSVASLSAVNTRLVVCNTKTVLGPTRPSTVGLAPFVNRSSSFPSSVINLALCRPACSSASGTVEAARRDGFSARLAIHPAQVPVINEVFTPTAEALAKARAIIAAFAAAPGAGVVAIDGVMYDQPHLLRARRLIARAKAAGIA